VLHNTDRPASVECTEIDGAIGLEYKTTARIMADLWQQASPRPTVLPLPSYRPGDQTWWELGAI
jgi:hypothetical protein